MPLYKDRPALALIVIGVIITCFSAAHLYQRDTRLALLNLGHDVDGYAARLLTETERSLTLMSTLRSFFRVGTPSRTRFNSVADDALRAYPQLHSIAWAPYVDRGRRAQFEHMRGSTRPDYRILDWVNGTLHSAPERAWYAPVRYRRGADDDLFVPGLDIAAADFGKELRQLDDDGGYLVDMLASRTRRLVESDEWVHYLTVVMPVYRTDTSAAQSLRGYLVGTLSIQSPLQDLAVNDPHRYIDLVVADKTRPGRTIYLLVNEAEGSGPVLEALEYTTAVESIGGRIWQVTATPTADYLAKLRSDRWLIVLGFGLPLSLLLGAYVHNLRSQNAMIESRVREKTQLLEATNGRLEAISRTDSLTQLANRRYFDEYLETEWNRARRDKRPLALVLADIDYFKAFNDRYGHVEGDHCLQHVALVLRGCFTRPGDLVARYGGEEFAAILPDTDLVGNALIDKCRLAVYDEHIAHAASDSADCITISLGACAVCPSDSLSIEEFIRAADQALYRAKQAGRNCGMVFDFTRGGGGAGVNVSG